ncbi:hypothetical protein ABMA28_012637 [Loxostege sticticalis]|uniref:Uncharacterized protein n=1 Tax=Loxostege sticticalis TaxID=481309 RepID=A0ABD0S4H4_LOXSC
MLTEPAAPPEKDTEKKKKQQGDCPTSCPARAVMVCGRCEHGVYKTFLSVCHMRMFVCNHDYEDKMELVSRFPCVLSAPYISDEKGMNMTPTGKEYDPHALDPVLKFIEAREKTLIGRAKLEYD